MSQSQVTREGLRGVRPEREAMTGTRAGRRPGGEKPMVPPAEFTSYYGKPVLKAPVWKIADVTAYLFLGGLAGASSLLAAGADLTGRPALSRVAKVGAFAGGSLSVAVLVHDLGRPARFFNMLRVVKVTSPVNLGSWLLAGYVPAAGAAALTALTGRLPRLGTAATAGSAVLGPAVAAYTAAVVSDTAVPAWHEGYREMPFVFVGSAASAAAGLGLLTVPARESTPARHLAVLGAAAEFGASQRLTHRLGTLAEPYRSGRAGGYLKLGQVLSAAGVAGAVLGRRSRVVTALSGAALMAASAVTRLGIYRAGLASAADPAYTVVPQRERLRRRAR